jgi:hypothetical protein
VSGMNEAIRRYQIAIVMVAMAVVAMAVMAMMAVAMVVVVVVESIRRVSCLEERAGLKLVRESGVLVMRLTTFQRYSQPRSRQNPQSSREGSTSRQKDSSRN